MSYLEIKLLASGLTADEPCGENLEYTPAFLELEQAAEEKPETQKGNAFVAALPPDWKRVKQQSLYLLQRSLDLRLATMLTRASLQVDGIKGFADGLSLIDAMLEYQWANLYPKLDPDDDNDPTFRVNTIASLIDSKNVLLPLRTSPIVLSRSLGSFCLRDVEIAQGQVAQPSDEETPSLAIIESAFRDAGLEQSNTVLQSLQQALLAAESIEKRLTAYVGVAHALDMSSLSKLLQRARDFVAERVQGLGGDTVVDATESASLVNMSEAFIAVGLEQSISIFKSLQLALAAIKSIENQLTAFDSASSELDLPALSMLIQRAHDFVSTHLQRIGGDISPEESLALPATMLSPVAADGEIESRDDALSALERVCEYYNRNEPSSPVPLLLLRAQRLAGMSFLEIVKEIAPGGLEQVLQVSGKQHDQTSECVEGGT